MGRKAVPLEGVVQKRPGRDDPCFDGPRDDPSGGEKIDDRDQTNFYKLY